MAEIAWLQGKSPAFRLMIATSWLAPDSWQQWQQEAIHQAIRAGIDWEEYLRLVVRHRTQALAWASLKRVPAVEIPASARQQLQERSDAWQTQAARISLRLVRVLKGFQRADIPVMPLKGPTLSSEVFGDERLRQYRDLDLAVASEDLPRAQACLEKMGWRAESSWFPLTPRQWESFLRHEYDLKFVDRHGAVTLELHWSNYGESAAATKARWARSIPAVWQGCSHRAMNPLDLLLYLCSHGGYHGWSRARWLGDLARIHAEEKIDWVQALEHATGTGQQRPLLACLRLLNEVYGLPLPHLPADAWKHLPRFLIDSPLRLLQDPGEPDQRSTMAILRERLRVTRYSKLVLPQRTWREGLSELAYMREDYRVLRLPDRFFWAYAPLRPALWAWRCAQRWMLRRCRSGTT